jgi:hypothetical protein
VLVHLRTVHFKAFAELDVGFGDQLFQMCLALDQWQFSQIVAVEIERSKATSTIFLDLPFSSFCNTEKSVVPSAAGTTISPSIIAENALIR